MQESPLRTRGPSSCEAIMGTRRTWQPYRRRKAAGSGYGYAAYLRLTGRHAVCRRPSISPRLAMAVPSGLERKVTGGGVGLVLQPAVYGPLIRGSGLLEPGAPVPDAVLILRRERCPDLPRNRHVETAEGGHRG